MTSLPLWPFTIGFLPYLFVVKALSVPFLGETVGRWRWLDADCEFASALVILQSGSSAFGSNTVIPLWEEILMTKYGALFRFAARRENAIASYFWTDVTRGLAMTLVALFF